jgi:hypothetical protein
LSESPCFWPFADILAPYLFSRQSTSLRLLITILCNQFLTGWLTWFSLRQVAVHLLWWRQEIIS